MIIDAVLGDITDWRADAVLFETNTQLMPNSPIQRAARIKDEEYIEVLRRHGRPLVAGYAIRTSAGHLPVKHLIHIPIPIHCGKTCPSGHHVDRGPQLIAAYHAGLRLAEELRLSALAVAPLIGNFPRPVAADCAVEALRFYPTRQIKTATLITLDREFLALLRERMYVDV